MTLSGIIAGLSGACGTGCALSRVTARMEATPTVEGRQARAGEASSAAGCSCGEAPCACGQTRFDTDDRVELSSPAQAERQLDDEQQQRVEELAKRDADVREHEQAHLSAAGGYARGGAEFEYTTGPDGRRYATGGEVQIDTSAVAGDPNATIQKMAVVQAAALAPSQPSSQDRRVAAYAAAALRKAQAEKARMELEEGDEQTAETPASSSESGARQPTVSGCAAAYSSGGAAQVSEIDAGPRRLDTRA